MLRRLGRFGEAMQIIEEGLDMGPTPETVAYLHQEKSLIQSKNTGFQPRTRARPNHVAVHEALVLAPPIKIRTADPNHWRSVLGAALLTLAVTPVSMIVIIFAGFYISEGLIGPGLFVAVSGLVVICRIFARFGRWLERLLGISFSHTG